jgi:hypothetical protein
MSRKAEQICGECGLPLSVCNAVAVIREARKRGHEIPEIADLLHDLERVKAHETALATEAEAMRAEIARCHARLEIDHEWRLVDGVETRVEIPVEDRATAYDAVACRDATIELLEDKIASLFRSLDAALAKLDGDK